MAVHCTATDTSHNAYSLACNSYDVSRAVYSPSLLLTARPQTSACLQPKVDIHSNSCML